MLPAFPLAAKLLYSPFSFRAPHALWTASAPALSFGLSQASFHPFLNQSALKFSHGPDDVKHQLS
jgi:hypothetical protein